MATRFSYFGFEYEIIEDKKNEVALIDGINASGRVFIPKEVEYQGEKYAVTQITGKEVSYSYYYLPSDKRCKSGWKYTNAYCGAFESKKRKDKGVWGSCWEENSKQLEIVISNSVTSIGKSAFRGCSGLTSVTIGSGVTSIGERAFSGCSGLTSVNVPSSVTSIGNEAFSGCSGLTSVTIPNSVTSMGYEVFLDCSGLTSVTIGSRVTSIGSHAFSGCSGLTSISIPNGVTSIPYEAFKGCIGLTSVSIPSSVTSIESYAFYRCSGLTSVNIPSSVTSIGNEAFKECNSLVHVKIENDEGEVLISATAFAPNVKIEHVGKPKGKQEKVNKQEAKPKTKPEPKPAKTASAPKVEPKPAANPESTNGNLTVASIAEAFKSQFGAVLRIYNGRSKADGGMSLQDVGLKQEISTTFDGKQKVGDFIAQMAKVGLTVKVYTCDDWVAVLDGLTLEQAGKVKKSATKADMEKML